MRFCPKCGSILIPKQGKLVCLRCAYKTTAKEETVMREKIQQKQAVDIIEKEVEILPLTDAKCSKCGHEKAYFWEIQTRAADEPATKFFKCQKCKHTWRDYS
ncbi:MAG: transcription factor S [Candidatus Pacearchaeota archaeon]